MSVLPDEIVQGCLELMCYFVTGVAAVFGWVLTGK